MNFPFFNHNILNSFENSILTQLMIIKNKYDTKT